MISVSGVSMRYGSKVLFDDVTTMFSDGRRYGLTGPNGAGKSTFMKLLTGDLQPQRGAVVRPERLGVLRQDQFAFDQFRVIDAVIMGNAVLWAALEERDLLYAKASLSDADGMRLGELEGTIGEHDGYSAESDAAVLLAGLDIPDHLHERPMSELQGGQKVRVLLAQALFGHPKALLLDEPTNHLDLDSIHWLREFLVRYDGRLRRHLARPPLPERRLHAHRRHRLPDDHHLHRRLRRHGAGQDADPLASRVAERAAREEDRAAQRLHPALLGRHALEPGAVAAQGSGAAADHRAGPVEHRAPVHQVHAEPALGPAGDGMQRRRQGPRRRAGHPRLRRHRQPRRADRARRPQRPGQDHPAEGAARRRPRPAGGARRSRRRHGALGPRGVDRLLRRRTTPARSSTG